MFVISNQSNYCNEIVCFEVQGMQFIYNTSTFTLYGLYM